ncbi:hypothetical protein HDU97_010248 [Phlyctochytrium planicorne]|nr:hypothetical protein HDU97_010248 [Phlyctochytrium planicorne]
MLVIDHECAVKISGFRASAWVMAGMAGFTIPLGIFTLITTTALRILREQHGSEKSTPTDSLLSRESTLMTMERIRECAKKSTALEHVQLMVIASGVAACASLVYLASGGTQRGSFDLCIAIEKTLAYGAAVVYLLSILRFDAVKSDPILKNVHHALNFMYILIALDAIICIAGGYCIDAYVAAIKVDFGSSDRDEKVAKSKKAAVLVGMMSKCLFFGKQILYIVLGFISKRRINLFMKENERLQSGINSSGMIINTSKESKENAREAVVVLSNPDQALSKGTIKTVDSMQNQQLSVKNAQREAAEHLTSCLKSSIDILNLILIGGILNVSYALAFIVLLWNQNSSPFSYYAALFGSWSILPAIFFVGYLIVLVLNVKKLAYIMNTSTITSFYTEAIAEEIDTFNDRISCNLITRHRENVRLSNNHLNDFNDEVIPTTVPSAPAAAPVHLSTSTPTSQHTLTLSPPSPSHDLASAYLADMQEEREILADQAAVSVAWRARDASRSNQECEKADSNAPRASGLIPGLDPSCAKALLRLHSFRKHLGGEDFARL